MYYLRCQMIYNINFYKSLSEKKFGDVLGAVNTVSKRYILFRIALDAIFVAIIMSAIHDTGILDKRFHSMIAFLFAFNSAEIMTNNILAYFIRKKVKEQLELKEFYA